MVSTRCDQHDADTAAITSEIKPLSNIIEMLNSTGVDGSSDHHWHAIARSMRVLVDVQDLAASLGRISGVCFEAMVRWSSETPSHYKWFAGDFRKSGGYRLWLHEFKEAEPLNRRLYARSVHDHRYPFASLILSGSYLHRWHSDDGAVTASSVLSIGDGYYLPAGMIHSIDKVVNNTWSLVVEGPAVLSRSREIISGGTPKLHIPMEERRGSLNMVGMENDSLLIDSTELESVRP